MDIETIKQVAWIGDEYLKGKIRGVVLSFHGLGAGGMGGKSKPETVELEWALSGRLVVFPYYGPWSWMNRAARGFIDELVDAIYENYGLTADIPLLSSGLSMGGLSSLLYARYAKRPVSACIALCPVCDVKYHLSERPDLPKTIYHAFYGYKESMEEIFAEHSPIWQVAEMPDIPYLIIHGDQDILVNKEVHSGRLVAKMRERGLKVEYIEAPEMGHCAPLSLAILEKMVKFINQAE